jgi:hypothetical protein
VLSIPIILTTHRFADVAQELMKKEKKKWRNGFYMMERRLRLPREEKK